MKPARMVQRPSPPRWHWYWLLVVPFIVMLWAPSYNFSNPRLGGIPFFYWYQFVWIAGTAVIIWMVAVLAHGRSR